MPSEVHRTSPLILAMTRACLSCLLCCLECCRARRLPYRPLVPVHMLRLLFCRGAANFISTPFKDKPEIAYSLCRYELGIMSACHAAWRQETAGHASSSSGRQYEAPANLCLGLPPVQPALAASRSNSQRPWMATQGLQLPLRLSSWVGDAGAGSGRNWGAQDGRSGGASAGPGASRRCETHL